MTNIAGVQVPSSRVSQAVQVLLAGYRVNGVRGLSTIQFCEAQVQYMIENGITQNHPIIDQYRIEADKERWK